MAERPSLPFETFPRKGLSYGYDPQQRANQQNGTGGLRILSIVPITFGVRVSGVTAGTYPVANRVATQSFTVPIGLVSASLSTSIVNNSSAQPVVVLISRNVGATIQIINNTDSLVEHTCEIGLGHSFRSGVGFADDIAPKYGSNEQIAIYVASDNSTSVITAVVTLRYFPLT